MQSLALDVEEMPVARVYADAAFAIAVRKGVEEEFAEEIGTISDLLEKNPRFTAFRYVGTIRTEDRRRVIDAAFKDRSSDLLYRLLCTLVDHDRLRVLPSVAARVRQLLLLRKGRVDVKVTSAKPLSSEQKDRVYKMLKDHLKAEPELSMVVDKNLIGGLKVAVGEKVYDYSVHANLERLREGILTRSTHEIQS